MSTISINRPATPDAIVAEMDRRGAVIVALEAEIDHLRQALALPDAERRVWFISDRLEKYGYFNRSDISNTFGISIPQASLDIRRWLESNPGAATYNLSTKRYERLGGNHA